MELTKVVLVIASCTLCAANSPTFLPNHKDVIYNYRAVVRAGTHFPESYTSSFTLEGRLHLQTVHNITKMRLTDLQYQMYNGVIDRDEDSKALAAPSEVEDLQKPFEVSYADNGLVVGLATGKNEKEFSRNIKRGIASIFQLDMSEVKGVTDKSPRSFFTTEKSVFGEGAMQYSILSKDDTIQVQKLRNSRQYSELYDNIVAHIQRPMRCDIDFRDLLSRNVDMTYLITEQRGHKFVTSIQSDNIIRYRPYEGPSDSYFVNVRQSFVFEDMDDSKDQMQVDNQHYETKLTYRNFDDNGSMMTEDLTNGRRTMDFDKIVPQVHDMIEGIRDYLRTRHVNVDISDLKKGQLINRVQRLLSFFDVHRLKELHSYLRQKTDPDYLDVYYHLLPVIGTKASATIIKDLAINRLVDDEMAGYLLKTFAPHMVSVPKSWLAEMEVLAQMDDKYNQDVRTAAILSFGTLVHKSFDYHSRLLQQQQEQYVTPELRKALQNEYEKYVLAYVAEIKNSKDYKWQAVYLDGLYNMRMDSIIHHLTPALNGQWTDDVDFRVAAMRPMASAANGNPDKVVEMFWPILSNRQENTLLRILSYYFIMEFRPSHSVMTQIQWLLKDEPNSELYHYHYTYVKSRSASLEPCNQNIKLQFAELLDHMQPATHGTSAAYLADYFDSIHKFSEQFKGHYINDNHRQFIGWSYAQQLNRFKKENTVFVKMNGLKGVMFDIGKQFNVNSDDVSAEVVVIKGGNVVEHQYYDKDNMKQLQGTIESLLKEKKTITKQFFDISYDRFTRIVIPTDLGIPVVYEDLQPIVWKSQLNINKVNINNLISVQFDFRHQSWIYYRHGLSFYNPMGDVWQGVNRYHSYDLLLPLRCSFTFNPQQRTMKISWQQHDNPDNDIAGIKMHVTSMVFVKDDFDTGVLTQSSPKSKQFQRVITGTQYQHSYPIVHLTNMNIGRQIETTMFDSHYYVSPGSFKNRMLKHRWNPNTKNWHSPMCYLWLSARNSMEYWKWLPEPGTFGILIRVVPLTNIDLTMRFNWEQTDDNSLEYLNGQKLSTRLTYVTKIQGQTLKTWDINAVIDSKDGRKLNNVKMEMTRIVPGQQDYKVCLEGVKKFGLEEVTGRWNMIMGSTSDGKCSNEAEIDITMKGTKSEEQVEKRHKYPACNKLRYYWIQPHSSLECLDAYSSLRQYQYDIKTKNVPTEFKTQTLQVMDFLKTLYFGHYTFSDEHQEKIGDNDMKVKVMYAIQSNQMDVTVTTKNHQYKFGGVPTKGWQWFGFIPDSTVYSRQFMFMHAAGMVDHCLIHSNGYRLNKRNTIKEEVPKEWTVYVAGNAKDMKRAVYVKQLEDNKIAVKVMDDNHVMEVMPKDAGYQITLDGQDSSDQEIYHADWIAYRMPQDRSDDPLVIMMPKLGVHVEYDGRYVMVVMALKRHHQDNQDNQDKAYGRCYSHM